MGCVRESQRLPGRWNTSRFHVKHDERIMGQSATSWKLSRFYRISCFERFVRQAPQIYPTVDTWPLPLRYIQTGVQNQRNTNRAEMIGRHWRVYQFSIRPKSICVEPKAGSALPAVDSGWRKERQLFGGPGALLNHCGQYNDISLMLAPRVPVLF